MPRRVTDRETLRKLKAEMPQLDIPGVADVGGVANVEHKNYSGPRKQFSWGAIPAAPLPAATSAPVAAPATSAAAAPTAEPSFTWGSVPAAPAAPAASKFNWGSVAAACPESDTRAARKASLEAEIAATRARLRGLEEQLRELCEAE
jgi:hypothetical protein